MSRKTLLVLAVLGAGWHLFLWSIGRTPELRRLAGDEQTYWAAAEQHFAGVTPPADLLWPPFYPRFLAFWWELAGRPSRLAVEAVQVLLLLAAAWLLARFARREGLPEAWAWGAGAALFFLPTPAAFAHYFWPEVLHLALFLGALELLRHENRKIWRAAAAGVLIGVALLTKSLLTGFLPLLLWADFFAGEKGRARWLRLAATVAAAILIVTPTILRNRAETGIATIADSSTFNLWVGLNDVSRQSHAGSIAWPELQAWRASAPTFAERDALLRARIAAKIEADGVLAIAARQLGRQYFRLFEKDSYLTDMLPHGTLAPERQGYQRMPPFLAALLRGLAWGSHLLLAALAGAGLALAPPPSWRRPWSLIGPAFLLYNLLIFLGLHVKSRYLLQMLPFLLIAAAWAGCRLAALARGGEEAPPSRTRLLAAAAAGALLLFCAAAGPWLDSLAGNSP